MTEHARKSYQSVKSTKSLRNAAFDQKNLATLQNPGYLVDDMALKGIITNATKYP